MSVLKLVSEMFVGTSKTGSVDDMSRSFLKTRH